MIRSATLRPPTPISAIPTSTDHSRSRPLTADPHLADPEASKVEIG